MLRTEEQEKILRAVEDLQLFHSPRRITLSTIGGQTALEGNVNIDDRQVVIRLVLDASFPLVLPQFFIIPWDSLGVIPHVNRDGFICFTDPEGLILDRRRPVAIIEAGYKLAMQVLRDGLHGKNQSDIVDEFEVYWNWLGKGQLVLSLLDFRDQVNEVTIAFENGKQIWAAPYSTDLLDFHNGNFEGSFTQQNALFLPLEPGTVIIPPRPDMPFWTAEEARNIILPGLSKANRSRLEKLALKYKHIHEYIFVGLPRPSGGSVFFGIQYHRVDRYHPLLKNGVARKLIPLQLQRVNQSYLIPRGGAETALGKKRVLLVGCGAIGGHLLSELVHAGIRTVTVIDPDVLTPENTFRHILGRQHWFKPKAKAIKEEIERQVPFVYISAIQDKIEHALSSRSLKLASFDLVILATGNPTIELEINEAIHKMDHGPLGIFTWVEPLGIGGHVLLTNNVEGKGCFECLYTSMIEGEAGLENRAAFAEQGQRFGRALSGCGTLFTPYGSIDAVRTAGLAARQVINALTGKERSNPLLSWKGDATSFLEAGFRLSHRYQASEEELLSNQYQYHTPYCPVCNSR
jgi:molybdopterin/thiamine biosynthesis adenylyltransferase